MTSAIGRLFQTLQARVSALFPQPSVVIGHVYVLTSDWDARNDPIRYFPDCDCLDTQSNVSIPRAKLSNPQGTTLADCETGVVYQVTKCDCSQ